MGQFPRELWHIACMMMVYNVLKILNKKKGQRSESPGKKKHDFRVSFHGLQIMLDFKGHRGQGQKPC